jgi:D-amino peptidase
MIGYHSRAGAETNPLAHTKTLHLDKVSINKRPASEFLINSLSAAMFKTPVVFISGDQGICQEAFDIIPKINFVQTFQGQGGSAICRHPEQVLGEIKLQVEKALSQNIRECLLPLPEKFELEVSFRQVQKAMKASFYPGIKRLTPFKVGMETTEYMDILSALMFISY